MFRAFVFASLFFLAGCSTTLPLALTPGIPVHVVGPNTDTSLQPTSLRYQYLQAWLTQNQGGWSQSYSTNPNGGILVSSDHLHLQFVGNAAFAVTSHGLFTKTVQESEYAFLVKVHGT